MCSWLRKSILSLYSPYTQFPIAYHGAEVRAPHRWGHIQRDDDARGLVQWRGPAAAGTEYSRLRPHSLLCGSSSPGVLLHHQYRLHCLVSPVLNVSLFPVVSRHLYLEQIFRALRLHLQNPNRLRLLGWLRHRQMGSAGDFFLVGYLLFTQRTNRHV